MNYHTYIKDADFVYAFALGVRLRSQVLVDVFEVGNSHILLELLVYDNIVIDNLNLTCQVLKCCGSTGLTRLLILHGARGGLLFYHQTFLLTFFIIFMKRRQIKLLLSRINQFS